jgi:small subunit ribosomal protein S13
MIPRIAGVILPSNKKILYALPYIYGIGLARAKIILENAKVDPDKRAKDLTEEELEKLRKEVEKFKVEGDLKMEVAQNIKRLIEINCYRGIRHKKQLPVRGQKTRKNCRTVRHNVRRTMGSGKKPPAQKT